MIASDIMERLAKELPEGGFADFMNVLKTRMRVICQQRRWHFFYDEYQFDLVAKYTTGTATATNGSTTVTGTDTVWTTADHDDLKIKIGGSGHYYTIDSITNNTELELTEAYYEDTLTDSTYQIYDDVYSLPTAMMWMKRLLNLSTQVYYLEGMDEDFIVINPDSDGDVQFQFWEIPTSDYPMLLEYYRWPTWCTLMSSTVDFPGYLEDALYYAVLEEYLSRMNDVNMYGLRIRRARERAAEALQKALTTDTMMPRPSIRLARRAFD